MGAPRSPENDELATVSYVQQLLAGLTLGTSSQTVQQIVDAAVAPLATKDALAQATQGLASTTALTMVAQSIPAFSALTPKSESQAGAVGTVLQIPPADHQHPRLTSSTPGTTDTNGNARITFTRSFATIPGVVLMAIENTNSAGPSMKVMKWLTKNTQGQLVDRSTIQGSTESYDGCVVYAWRGRALPTLTPITVGTLLTGVITGVNNLISALTGYEPYVAAGNVSFTCIAVQNSTT